MVKECSVILNNEAVTVVKYDGKDIQFPSIHKDAKKIFVNYENGKYSIVDENFKSQSVVKSKKKSATKKTTVKENLVDADETAVSENE